MIFLAFCSCLLLLDVTGKVRSCFIWKDVNRLRSLSVVLVFVAGDHRVEVK